LLQGQDFLNGYGIRTITYNAKNREQAKGKTDLKLYTFKQNTEQKNREADQHKTEQVVFSSCYGIIEITYNEQNYNEIQRKTKDEFQEEFRVYHLETQKRKLLEAKKRIQHD
jgi:hypothetical protein